ncbi:hypothetical protein AAFF_G00020000 [Aldrovandia affinis]|uniref:DH domain-containing protein n=1 Tax=Aldrovandia affinis TaxID=143900 RepID=A0AAD7R2E4_9TELE|nr:hypothetical protein AAFF_G00020000 [Aldrovandia affinis]
MRKIAVVPWHGLSSCTSDTLGSNCVTPEPREGTLGSPSSPKPRSSAAQREKERRGNPILKYISNKPQSNQPIRPGSVWNMIQQFEQQPDPAGGRGGRGAQRLSTSSLGRRHTEQGSLRLARSESLKAQGEGRRRGSSAGVEAVPRSRSNVDMEDYGEERLLGNSTSSSTSSTSASVSVELSEGDSGEVQNWQETVDPQTLLALGPREVDRQAVIYELYTTEVSHLRTLRVLDQVFFQNMQAVLSLDQLTCIFPNLPQVYRLHNSLCESMKNLRESPIVQGIGDIMLARFGGVAGAEFLEEVSLLCSQQSQSLELIKNKQKDPRFSQIIQECELSPLCRRLQLKDLLVSETQRLTKYPLLLDNIIRHTHPLSRPAPLQRAQACCRGILQAVNEVVRRRSINNGSANTSAGWISHPSRDRPILSQLSLRIWT